MNWEDIIGHSDLKSQLKQSIVNNRIGHALLFTGKEGYGVFPLVLAFCKEIFKNENSASISKVDNLNYLDLHFSFPSYSVSGKNLSKNFTNDFRKLSLDFPYFDFDQWTSELDCV